MRADKACNQGTAAGKISAEEVSVVSWTRSPQESPTIVAPCRGPLLLGLGLGLPRVGRAVGEGEGIADGAIVDAAVGVSVPFCVGSSVGAKVTSSASDSLVGNEKLEG